MTTEPNFVLQNFEKFLEEYGINHEISTPYWPQANGEVERLNKTLLKAIRTANVEGKDWRKDLPKFLSAYRSTPHTLTELHQTNSFSDIH